MIWLIYLPDDKLASLATNTTRSTIKTLLNSMCFPVNFKTAELLLFLLVFIAFYVNAFELQTGIKCSLFSVC